MSGTARAFGLLVLTVLAPSCGTPDGPTVPGEASGVANTLSWTAESEQGVYGYLVYRAEERDGPFLRVNETIVRVPADEAERHEYTWVDSDVEPGKVYHYYLDAVSTEGVKQRFSGILSRETPRKADG